MFMSVDIDNSGFIDFQEFIQAAQNQKSQAQRELLVESFKYFDKDGSGKISAEEIKEVLGFGGNLTAKEITVLIKQVDANGDGEIDFDEFV